MNYENEFEEWLSRKVSGNSTVSNYKVTLRQNLPQELEKFGNNDFDNLFKCDNLEYLQTLQKRLLKEGDLHVYNQNKKNFPSAAIGKYIEFLEQKDSSIIVTPHKKEINTKNIILYGSPGVGKTYNHKKLISLIESRANQKEIFDAIRNNDFEYDNALFETVKKENRFKFVTFHQSYSYEDFIEGFRPNEDGSIKLEDGIFKEMSEEASKNLLASSLTSHILDFENILEQFQIDFEIGTVLKTVQGKEFVIVAYSAKSIQIQVNDNKFAISYIPLKKIFLENEKKEIKRPSDVIDALDGNFRGLATYYYPIFRELLKYNAKEIEPKPQKNFYLLIDEINRGNISKIFGELITLIEDDKRDEIEVTLPYSKESFKVPSNLYIIATMNSTDKSIALIDVALRRRFTFLKMQPDVSLVDSEARELFSSLNAYIKNTLGADYQIGHSYFMDCDLEFVLEYKIKPLLEEYFYGDEKGLKEAEKILGVCSYPLS